MRAVLVDTQASAAQPARPCKCHCSVSCTSSSLEEGAQPCRRRRERPEQEEEAREVWGQHAVTVPLGCRGCTQSLTARCGFQQKPSLAPWGSGGHE